LIDFWFGFVVRLLANPATDIGIEKNFGFYFIKIYILFINNIIK